MRRSAMAMAAALLLLAAPAARAQEGSDAYRALIRDAVAEYAAGRYQEALALFEEAHALSPSARVLRGIAKSQFELRRYARALATLDSALARPEEELPAELRDELRALRERTQRYVGTVRVSVKPARAEVVVDGAPLPLEARDAHPLDVGHHEVQASAPGYEPARRAFDVRSGETARVDLVLVSRPPAGGGPATTVIVSAPPEASRAPLYVGTAVGVIGLGAVVASIVWFADRDAAVDRCTTAAGNGARCDAPDAIARERDAAAWAIAGGAAVAVGAGVAIAIWATQGGASRVACGGPARGLDCRAAFRF
jgi:tetratricopeptide (TPR) repeat protein